MSKINGWEPKADCPPDRVYGFDPDYMVSVNLGNESPLLPMPLIVLTDKE